MYKYMSLLSSKKIGQVIEEMVSTGFGQEIFYLFIL